MIPRTTQTNVNDVPPDRLLPGAADPWRKAVGKKSLARTELLATIGPVKLSNESQWSQTKFEQIQESARRALMKGSCITAGI